MAACPEAVSRAACQGVGSGAGEGHMGGRMVGACRADGSSSICTVSTIAMHALSCSRIAGTTTQLRSKHMCWLSTKLTNRIITTRSVLSVRCSSCINYCQVCKEQKSEACANAFYKHHLHAHGWWPSEVGWWPPHVWWQRAPWVWPRAKARWRQAPEVGWTVHEAVRGHARVAPPAWG